MVRSEESVESDVAVDVFGDGAAVEESASGEVATLVETDPLNVDDARQLTETIRGAAEMLWMLIMRAHQGRAWEVLGYASWEDYVRAEFNMSRSRSYQILDQGRVIRAIEGVMPEGSQVSLSEAAARDLKGVLDDLLPQIAERTEGMAPTDASVVLDEIVEEQRELIRSRPEDARPDVTDSGDVGDAGVGDDFPEYGDDFDALGDDFDEYGGSTGGGISGGVDLSSDAEHDYDDDEGFGDTDGVDLVHIRRLVTAGHEIYAAIVSLAEMPDDLEEVARMLPAERHNRIDESLASASANLERFGQIWVSREK